MAMLGIVALQNILRIVMTVSAWSYAIFRWCRFGIVRMADEWTIVRGMVVWLMMAYKTV